MEMAIKIPKIITENEFLEGIKKIKTPKNNHVKLAFMLGFYQCLRVSEVVNLKPEDVNAERNTLHIRNAKGGKDRIVPIMKPVKKGLKHLPVGVGIRALQLQVKKYFPQHHFHTLRHSGATFYLNDKDVDIRYIQQLLGHTRLDTTQIYTHIDPRQLIDKFDGLW